METKHQTTDPLKLIKESFTISDISVNLSIAISEMKIICEQRDYIVEGSFDELNNIDLQGSTLSSRKKLARKIYYFMKKKTRRTMTALLSVLRKRHLGDEYRISVKPSILEQQINALREKYKKLRSETEEVRLKFKEAKKLLKENKSVYDNK